MPTVEGRHEARRDEPAFRATGREGHGVHARRGPRARHRASEGRGRLDHPHFCCVRPRPGGESARRTPDGASASPVRLERRWRKDDFRPQEAAVSGRVQSPGATLAPVLPTTSRRPAFRALDPAARSRHVPDREPASGRGTGASPSAARSCARSACRPALARLVPSGFSMQPVRHAGGLLPVPRDAVAPLRSRGRGPRSHVDQARRRSTVDRAIAVARDEHRSRRPAPISPSSSTRR